jgi:voltage-gated potassium channel
MLGVLVLFKRFVRTLRKDRLDRVLLALVVIVLAGMLGMAYFDSLPLADSLWWTIVTITTVGYGDIYPASLGGRVVGVLLMLFGIGFLGLLTATLASIFVEERRQEEKGVNSVRVTQHLLLCGWNYKAKEIVAEIRANDTTQIRPVVLIAELAENPWTMNRYTLWVARLPRKPYARQTLSTPRRPLSYPMRVSRRTPEMPRPSWTR